jgi:hypothetical protein
MGACLAYDPVRAKLHTLNPSAWLILSLCDGRAREAIAADFAAATRGLPGAVPEQGAFSRGLALLTRLGLVTTHSPGHREKELSR